MSSTTPKTWEETITTILEKTNTTNNTEFKDWLKSREHLGYYVSPTVWARSYKIWKDTQTDSDHFTVIIGKEGSGKSVLALNVAVIVSPNFTINNVCFDISEFITQVKTAQKGDTLLLDEGAMFLFTREAMGRDNKKVIKLFTLLRQRNLHIIVCMPRFWDIDTYIREHRVNTILRVKKNIGNFVGYTDKAISIINEVGRVKKYIESIKVPNGTFFYGDWKNHYPNINGLNEQSYRKKKAKHLIKVIEEMDQEIKQEDKATAKYISIKEVMKTIPGTEKTFIRRIKQNDIPGTKIGGRWYINKNFLSELQKKGAIQADMVAL